MLNKIQEIKKHSHNLCVLYIESNPTTLAYTRKFLEDIFENVITAKNEEEGFKKFQSHNIDLIITDIILPQLNSLELIQKIRDLGSDVHIIIVSQHNEPEQLLKSIELDVDGYVLKPVELEILVDTIQKTVKKLQLKYDAQNSQYYLDQYLSLIEKSNMISKTNRSGKITYANDSFCKVYGYNQDELIGKNHRVLKHPDNPKELYEDMWYTIKDKKQNWEGMVKNISKNGKSYYVKTIITPIKNIKDEVVEYIAVRNNINAIIDDKKYLFKKIEENNLSILVLIQIDEFEMLEKFYNTVTMDQLEKNFAFHLKSYLPKEYKFENIYALGQGKFALLDNFDNFEKTNINLEDYLNQFAQNVKKSILKFDDMEFDINVLISYATGKYLLFEDAKAGLDEALKKETKLNFSNDASIAVFNEAKENFNMIKTVKIALDNYKIVSYFQPIINNSTQKIEKYESLVRLIDEDDNIISPFAFIDISKKGNYYHKITKRVLENSFKILDKINTEISINISITDIKESAFQKRIFRHLENYKINTNRIVFELLEDENVKDFDTIANFIKKVKEKGVKIAIDDFGTGYSNFERILIFEPDILKIDGSLIKNIDKDNFSKNLVETIVMFAKKQNIKTVAEFVENENIFNILKEIGLDYSQGYYFGKPKEL